MNAICAMSLNRAIGFKNKIPWHIPEELAWFRSTTLNSNVLMGRKTFESIGSKPLPNRKNYVLSSQPVNCSNVIWLKNIDEIHNLSGTLWVCGGEQVYKKLLPSCENLYITIINKTIKGDAFFPEFETMFVFNKIIRQTIDFTIQLWSRSINGCGH